MADILPTRGVEVVFIYFVVVPLLFLRTQAH